MDLGYLGATLSIKLCYCTTTHAVLRSKRALPAWEPLVFARPSVVAVTIELFTVCLFQPLASLFHAITVAAPLATCDAVSCFGPSRAWCYEPML